MSPAEDNRPATTLRDAAKSPCPVCFSTRCRFQFGGRDRLFDLADGVFHVYRCTDCGCAFQQPMPGQEDLARYYPAEYWWVEERESIGMRAVASRLESLYLEHVLAHHVRRVTSFVAPCHRTRKPRLLDLGCGNGTFLRLMRSAGYEVHGQDASAQAVRIARERYGLDVRQGVIGSPVWNDERFDVVTLFHVLEHIPDPRPPILHAAGLVSSGGSLIFQVPNLDSIQARVFGRRWHGLDLPRHVIDYTPRSMRLLLESCGLSVAEISHFSLRDNAPAWASSLLPALDPVGSRVRFAGRGGMARLLRDVLHLAMVLAATPLALLESALGMGGTIFVHAQVGHTR